MKDEVQNMEKEQQIYNALCVNYTAAYCCDLMTDHIELIKQKDFSHSAQGFDKIKKLNSYTEWIRYAYDNILVKESAPDYLEQFDRENLMRRLKTEESFRYRHRTIPNQVGMEFFEVVAVRLYEDADCFKVILGYQPMDDIFQEEVKRQKQLEKALRAAQIANQSKTEFLSRMSHDIRTPLNGIIGLLNIDESHFDDMELVKANHVKMRVAANHLLSLINDVLQMSKLEDDHMEIPREEISLIDLTQDIVAIVVDRAIEAGIRWEFEKEKSVIPYPYIYGSSLHLRQIFLNIYGNCIKYNRPGGYINTIVQDLGCEDGICTYRWIISDTGIGMSPEFLENIFEPFAQEKYDARSNYQGTGLGMAIVKKILDLMGGNISVTSKQGMGTTFVIDIPFEIAEAPPMVLQHKSDKEASIAGRHLMLVEDNDLNAEIARTLLEDMGARVSLALNGREAVWLFEENPAGTFDAILMDVMMPVMNGLEATRAIREMERSDAAGIPIIAMTANAFKEDIRRCLDAGMNAHIAKPLDMEIVKRTICDQISEAEK